MINDLTKNPPRSDAIRLGGYVILARAIDKCRSTIAGKAGDYHFNCPVDKQLFGFKDINADEFKTFVETGASDDEIVAWINTHGPEKTPGEIKEFSDKACSNYPAITKNDFGNWFIEECNKLSLDPTTTTLFHWLDVDDKVSFVK